MRSPVLSLFSTNKNTKFVKTTIYTELFHTAQTKARQVLGKTRKFVKYNDLHTPSGLYNADESQNG